MSEMVERVARAIHDAGFPENLRDETWNDRRWKECAMGQALAALRAMREPTDAMDTAMRSEIIVDCDSGSIDGVEEAWSAAIDAAINEGK